MSSSFHASPVIIIGAARSGTNMLRDILCSLPGFGTWPCDEINYIWRYGNERHPNDELAPEQAREPVKRYIRKAFERVAAKRRLNYVVEKTCANSFRVEFVDQVFPDALYVYIVRDGLDIVASAKKRWAAKLDIPYLLRKVRYVPLANLPYYASRYFMNRLFRLFSREQRLAYWGPLFNGFNEMLAKYTLDEVCALQWQRCVDRADEAFAGIESDRVCNVSYETFVSSPRQELIRIARFVGVDIASADAESLVKGVSKNSVGKGRQELCQETVGRLEKLVGSTLKRHGYAS